MLLDISCYFPGVEGMGRKLGTNVVMKEPQLLQSLLEVYTDGESRFVLPGTACPFGTAETLQQRNACFSSAEKYLS